MTVNNDDGSDQLGWLAIVRKPRVRLSGRAPGENSSDQRDSGRQATPIAVARRASAVASFRRSACNDAGVPAGRASESAGGALKGIMRIPVLRSCTANT